MPKAIAHPTDSRLLEKSRKHLVKLATELPLQLRQNYNRQASHMAAQIFRYAHAKQFKRMRKNPQGAPNPGGLRVPRGRSPDRSAARTSPGQGEAPAAPRGTHPDAAAQGQAKAVCVHAPEVECISKGKARTPYEFGLKVTIATTLNEGLVLEMRSMPGNPYDGHTLDETIEQVEILAEQRPGIVIVDKGYRGMQVQGVQILRSGQRRGITRTLKAMIKRRIAIEPTTGHMKMDGRLARNPLEAFRYTQLQQNPFQ